MRQAEIDEIEQWVAQEDIGTIDAKLTTVGARDYINYRAALLNGRDKILRNRAQAQHVADMRVARRAQRIAIAAVVVSVAGVVAQVILR